VLISGLRGRQRTGDVSHKDAVGCHYFLSWPRLPSQLQSVTAFWPVQISAVSWTEEHVGTTCL